MDVDCDGADDKAGDCSNDPSGYGETAFKDTVKGYGISDLNANIHPYVVFNEKPFFDPGKYGMKPLSVMAVVCNNQLVSRFLSVSISSGDDADLYVAHVSGTVSGEIPTRSPRRARRPSRWPSCASPKTISRATTATGPRTFCTLVSLATRPFRARAELIGRPRTARTLRTASKRWVTSWWLPCPSKSAAISLQSLSQTM